MNPASGGIQGITPCSSAILMEGARRDQKLAAIITPAANPSMPSSALRFILLKKNTSDAPRAVTNHVKHVANKACTIGFRVLKYSMGIKFSRIYILYSFDTTLYFSFLFKNERVIQAITFMPVLIADSSTLKNGECSGYGFSFSLLFPPSK